MSDTLTKVYTGTVDEQEDAFEADRVEAAKVGWEPARREQTPDSLRVTYRMIGSDLPTAEGRLTAPGRIACPECGKTVAAGRTRFCNHCGAQFRAWETPPVLAQAEVGAPSIIRSYRGDQQADALVAFRADAANLAAMGYVPVSQSWAQGQWGCAAFLVAALLAVVLIGFLVFVFLIVVKPDGTLTVTYVRVGITPLGGAALDSTVALPAMPSSSVAPSALSTLSDRLRQLDDARAAGLIDDAEYQARRTAILASA